LGGVAWLALGAMNGSQDFVMSWIQFRYIFCRNLHFHDFSQFASGITSCPHHSRDQGCSKTFIWGTFYGHPWWMLALSECFLVLYSLQHRTESVVIFGVSDCIIIQQHNYGCVVCFAFKMILPALVLLNDIVFFRD